MSVFGRQSTSTRQMIRDDGLPVMPVLIDVGE